MTRPRRPPNVSLLALVAWATLSALAGCSCEDPCRTDPRCLEDGRCMSRDGNCVAASDEDCRNTAICASEGRCTAGTSGACIAASAADCQRASVCQRAGKCTAADERCVAVSDDACRAAETCGAEGRCSFASGFESRECQIARGEMAVDPAPLELPEGALGAIEAAAPPTIPNGCYPHCTVTSDAECEASTACRSEGRCVVRIDLDRFEQPWCVRPEHVAAGGGTRLTRPLPPDGEAEAATGGAEDR